MADQNRECQRAVTVQRGSQGRSITVAVLIGAAESIYTAPEVA